MRKAGAYCPNLAFERSSNGIASPDRPSRNIRVQFDDVSTSGPEPLVVGYRHRIGLGRLGLGHRLRSRGHIAYGTHRLDPSVIHAVMISSSVDPS